MKLWQPTTWRRQTPLMRRGPSPNVAPDSTGVCDGAPSDRQENEPLPHPESPGRIPNTASGATNVAANHIVTRVPRAKSGDRVQDVLTNLPGRRYDSTDAVYVLDDQERLRGVVPLRDLLGCSADQSLQNLIKSPFLSVKPGTDQETVVSLAARHGLPSVPVVDEAGCLLGVVPAPALVEILGREHAEDVHRLAGIVAPDPHATAALEAAVASRAAARLPWLAVGLVGSVGATAVMARFEHALQSNIVIAFFVPAIVYLADAIGTQTEAISVRYLNVGHRPLARLLGGELVTGLLISLCLGAVAFPAVLLWNGRPSIAAAVALAVVGAGVCAAGAGLMFPWLLSKAGKDPAFGSGPVATIIQDILSLLIYFGLVQLLVA